MNRQTFSVSLAGIAGALLAVVVWSGVLPLPQEQLSDVSGSQRTSASSYHTTTILDPAFFEDALARATDFGERPESRVWILPHHLVAKELIAGFLKAQAVVKNPPTIVIIGPDHLGRASSPLVTTDLSWRTPFGFMEPHQDYIAEITQAGHVAVESVIFDEEHSVSALVPLVHQAFPEAKIVPLLVQDKVDPETRYAVADILADDMVVVISSVDFSHYLPSDISEFHDDMSRRVLEDRDYSRLTEVEIDSPAALAFAFDFAEQTASEEFDFYIREDSDSFFGYPIYEGTSYILGGFTHLEQPETDAVTLLAVGDMMFGRAYSQEVLDPFARIAGAEERFFRGVDVIMGNLEGALAAPAPPVKTNDFAFAPGYADLLAHYNFDAVSLANNHSLDQGEAGFAATVKVLGDARVAHVGHQENEVASVYTTTVSERTIAVVGINLIEQAVDETQYETLVRQNAAAADHLVAYVHWGEEFATAPSVEQRRFGRQLVEWGAAAVIGTHPHVIQGMEVYQSAPIFWSLGNFVFDQTDTIETQTGLAAGLTFSPSTTTVRVFPLHAGPTPQLATSSRAVILDAFIERSTLDNVLRPSDAEFKLELTV